MDNQYNPEVYTPEEIEQVEAHIEKWFGKFENVFHEIVSPDIHVDIAIIAPSEERSCYTLVTMGMGAHRMNVPEELAEYRLERAEMMICLPPDWDLKNQDETWYWPLRWLKVMARLPGEHDTWLGWGHTVPAGEPFAENTELCGIMLLGPGMFPPEASECRLEGGDAVHFYQMIPLYAEEMDFKVENGAEALLDKMGDDLLGVMHPDRHNCCKPLEPRKSFAKSADEIKPLLEWEGPEGCLATDRITVDGCRVGYMYREEPHEGMPDSGWRFTAGDESDAYMDNPDNSGVYSLNTICNYDPEIIPRLKAPAGTAYIRDADGSFRKETHRPPRD